MKGCIVLQNQYAKFGHAIALELKKKHGVSKFCAYIFSPGAKEFIQSQDDIKYDPVLVDHELHENYKKEDIDLEYIRRFENEYSEPHLWSYLYTDRKLMMSIGPKEETTTVIDPLYDHETLLLIFQARAKAIEKMLKESKPDFIIFFAIGVLGHMILYHVAKKLDIKTYNVDYPRIGSRVCISEDYNTLTGVIEKFKEFKIKDNVKLRKDAVKFIDAYRKTGSLALEYHELNKENKPKSNDLLKPKNIIRSIKYLNILYSNYSKNKKLFTYGETDQNPLRFILYKLKKRFRGIKGISKLCSQPNFSENYAFFPLHYEPELALLLLSPFYFDQIALIRQIARSLPLDFKLYVNEHPSMQNKRCLNYYKEIAKIPNVRLIDFNIKSHDIIKNSNLVTTITGTVGWEACLLGKPVITFGEVFFSNFSSVKRVRNIEELPHTVKSLLSNFSHDEEELIRLVEAIFDDSFEFQHFKLWYEDFEKVKNDRGIKDFAALVYQKLQE